FTWKIDTKYYQADISLKIAKDLSQLESLYCDENISIKALIILADSSKNIDSFFEDEIVLKSIEFVETKIFLDFDTNYHSASNIDFLRKCFKNKIEWISLCSTPQDAIDFKIQAQSKYYGLARCKEAIENHSWPN
ncbi:hypothetical protein MXB_3523, partial [Myxobolus squamalis]